MKHDLRYPMLVVAALASAGYVAAASAADAPPANAPVAAPPVAAPAEAAPDSDDRLLRRRRGESDAPPAAIVEDTGPKLDRRYDPLVAPSAFSDSLFRPDPTYPTDYNAAAQQDVYGGKHAIDPPRPLLELGYPMYSGGALGADHNLLGDKNLVRPQFLAFGDYRAVYGANEDAQTKSLIATRLNLDLDLKLTGTERFHALMRPLDHDGKFTRLEFKGAPTDNGHDQATEFNLDPATAFFEGDLGQIAQGITGNYNGVDLPIAAGLVPLFFQNGVWLDDAFDGLAVTIPARNSSLFDISNMDFTFFAGWDEVSTAALKSPKGALQQHTGDVYGVASFFERRGWYYEADYGYLDDRDKTAAFDRSYNNVSFAATKRFGAWLSNSTRVIYNFGQDKAPDGSRTANGAVLLSENSFITRRPYTLLPYLNLFYGEKTPQSIARDPGAGGVLKNVGINFETDNLTGFPKLADTGANAYGGAFGLEYLFNLDRQVVIEAAALDRHGADKELGSEYALGIRFQQPFAVRWIFRTDAIVGDRSEGKNFWGARVELRCKF
jgi:hypothetical protein